MNDKVGRVTPARNQGVMIVSESASELKEIKDMLSNVKTSLGYITKLLESLVSHLDLSHKRKSNQAELMKMYQEVIPSLFAGKDFQGKEKVLEFLNKISEIGSE